MEPSSSDPSNVPRSSSPHRQNDVRYTDFMVSVADSDQDFILQLPRSLITDGEASTGLSSSCGDHSIWHDRLHAREPNFSFLGERHSKLMELSNKSLSNYITRCQQESEEIMGQFRGGNNTELVRFEEEREIIKLFSMFFSAMRPEISNARYVQRLVLYLALPSYVYVLAFIYIEKLGNSQMMTNPNLLRLTPDNTHRVVITACFIAAQMLAPSLSQVNFEHFSKVGGTQSADELQRLVAAFGKVIRQNFKVTKAEFRTMLEKL